MKIKMLFISLTLYVELIFGDTMKTHLAPTLRRKKEVSYKINLRHWEGKAEVRGILSLTRWSLKNQHWLNHLWKGLKTLPFSPHTQDQGGGHIHLYQSFSFWPHPPGTHPRWSKCIHCIETARKLYWKHLYLRPSQSISSLWDQEK